MRKISEVLRSKPTSKGQKELPWVMDFQIPLKTVTPVIGGGVDSLEPDKVDGVRVPSIRGQLRTWWRALQPEVEPAKLFVKEHQLWGGVGTDDANTGVRSNVVITVEVMERGTIDAAGVHEQDQKGKLKILPRWKDNKNLAGKRLGYGLFPLQRSKSDLEKAGRASISNLPTRDICYGLEFKLRVRVRNCTEPAALRHVIGAVWFWVHFGGIGARTTRGFGALCQAGDATFRDAHRPLSGEDVEKWLERFRPARSLQERAKEVLSLTTGVRDNVGQRTWPHVSGAEMWTGAPESTPADAHAVLVESFRHFRQGNDMGRRGPTSDNTPGTSFWPEANWLRTVTDSYELRHKPEIEDPLQYRAPRAAFGLPLVIKFKQADKRDVKANGTIQPIIGARLTSPLRLCVIKGENENEWFPAVLVFTHRLDKVVVVTDSGKKGETTTTGSAGAGGKIKTYIDRGSPQDGVGAFVAWLRDTKSFQKQSLP